MPLEIAAAAPTIIIRRDAFERAKLTRVQIDERWNLTPDEFRVEGPLIAIGPLHGEHDIGGIIEEFEELGLGYFDDFFELSGNWPEWIRLLVLSGRIVSDGG
jgi:hypothetical protein